MEIFAYFKQKLDFAIMDVCLSSLFLIDSNAASCKMIATQ